ncbi:MAG: DUF262 domain-containing protein [Proteobacteria bacterium]|nr:DUF262 domain-containing protein [Pseudomonadota bacterium]
MADTWAYENTEDQVEEDEAWSYKISSYPADITLGGYMEKWNTKQLFIPPFQRNYVWDQVKASRLIESFLLGLPVPGVFLYKDSQNKLAVIDGQQRIMSAIRFFQGKFNEKIFRLRNVQEKWEGKLFTELSESDQYELQDAVLRATVVQQLDPDDNSSIYHIFERLNTGGINLNPMEIRKCVYFGKVFELLEELNQLETWRKIIGKKKVDKRLRDVELILRCLALYTDWENYEKPMKSYLNSFMCSINKLTGIRQERKIDELRELFTITCEWIHDYLPEKPFHLRNRINYAAMDSIFNAIANLDEIDSSYSSKYNSYSSKYNILINDEDYIESTTKNTSDDKTLSIRFRRVLDILD